MQSASPAADTRPFGKQLLSHLYGKTAGVILNHVADVPLAG